MFNPEVIFVLRAHAWIKPVSSGAAQAQQSNFAYHCSTLRASLKSFLTTKTPRLQGGKGCFDQVATLLNHRILVTWRLGGYFSDSFSSSWCAGSACAGASP